MPWGRVSNRGIKMKKLGIVLSAVAALAIASGPALAAAKKKAAPKKLWQGWVEEVSKAKWTWKAPAKGKKKA